MEDIVVESLLSGNREAQIEAAIELSHLSRKQRQKMSEREIISPLLSMLQSQDSITTEVALSALLSLAFGSERNKVRIVKSGAVPMLLEILQSETKMVILEMAMAFLLILSSCNKNKVKMASTMMIQLLVGLIGLDRLTIQAKVDGIATLQNLSTLHQIVPLVIASGAPYALLQVINFCDKASELAHKAAALLENIVSHSPESISSISGAIGVMVEAIEEGSAQCKEHAVGILLCICSYDRETNRGMILREGVMPGLLQVSVDGTRRAKEMARELLLLLRDCSGYVIKNKQSKIEQIMREIDQEGERIPGTMLKLVEDMISKLTT
ncbi:U-box domain-containing protein 3 [Capsella rubella]|nr:U-box domain-containing protein 3 [Capsella rubella]